MYIWTVVLASPNEPIDNTSILRDSEPKSTKQSIASSLYQLPKNLDLPFANPRELLNDVGRQIASLTGKVSLGA
jgi:hypothetical protein